MRVQVGLSVERIVSLRRRGVRVGVGSLLILMLVELKQVGVVRLRLRRQRSVVVVVVNVLLVHLLRRLLPILLGRSLIGIGILRVASRPLLLSVRRLKKICGK